MRQAGLRAVQKRRQVCTTDSHHSDPVAPNLLQRDFSRPLLLIGNGSRILSVCTAEGWLYLVVVLDVYSRLIVGSSMTSHREKSLVEAALWLAVG